MTDQSSVGFAFWILSAVIVISGFMVVSLRNIFHCAIALIMCLSAIAGIYILLNAEFLAAAQVLIYVGAVAILMVFAIMLTTDLARKKLMQTNRNALVAFFGCLVFLCFTTGLLWVTTKKEIWNSGREMLPPDNIMSIGKVLMLAALVGAIVLARQEKS
jgi:NADH:ubiquinone oxidoreductase subunit 6 (subunit J)